MNSYSEDMRCISPRGKKWRVRVMVNGVPHTGSFSTVISAKNFRDSIGSKKYLRDQSIPTINTKSGFLFQESQKNSAKTFSRQEIVNSGMNINSIVISGIYFLINAESVVYVGQSLDIFSRIKAHRAANLIEFTSVTIMPTHQELLNHLEKKYIQALLPTHNVVHKDAAYKVVLAQELLEKDIEQQQSIAEAIKYDLKNNGVMRKLFYLIKLNSPKTIKELGLSSDLETAYLSSVLRRMENFGILFMKRNANASKPILLVPDFDNIQNGGPYLTKTEFVILEAIKEKNTIPRVAQKLEISVTSCQVYVENAQRKLRARTINIAIKKCIDLKMFSIGGSSKC